MLKNITLSADQYLITKARNKAKLEHTTLNARFRQWLESYTVSDVDNVYANLMQELSYAQAAGFYSRDDLNER